MKTYAMILGLTLGGGLALAACSPNTEAPARFADNVGKTSELTLDNAATAVFAGGCFWCTEADFEKVPGVLEAVSGYTGGTTENPTYEQVTYGDTGHYEAVKVYYDPAIVSYEELVEYFWTTIDPTDARGQFCDKGPSYRSAIFVTDAQADIANDSRDALIESERVSRVMTGVLELGEFYIAEDYHQNYYKENPVRYSYYRDRCGRDQRLKQLWGDTKS